MPNEIADNSSGRHARAATVDLKIIKQSQLLQNNSRHHKDCVGSDSSRQWRIMIVVWTWDWQKANTGEKIVPTTARKHCGRK